MNLVSVASAVGKIFGVERKSDIYRDFFITGCEVAAPAKLHPEQMKLLKDDPNFCDKKCYLVTAVQPQGSGELTQRRFLLNEAQAARIGLRDNMKEGEAAGGSTKVILDKKVTFKTLGQYLESIDFFGKKTPIANIYPRVQCAVALSASPAEKEKVDEALRTKGAHSGLKVGWYSWRL